MASSKQISELKKVLEQRKLEIENNIEDGKTNIVQLKSLECKDEYDFAESSSDSFTFETIVKKQLKELEDIKNALKAIEEKKYGICEMCDEMISIERLKAKPFAKYCTTCREVFEAQKN